MSHLNDLRNNSFIREKVLDDGVSSFNFTRKCFYEKEWNDSTIKARGLFVDTHNDRVVARSYNKFFNINERPETQYDYLKKNFKYPVKVYLKENGFLGICSVHNGELFLASKSTNEGDFAEYFKNLFYKTFDEETRTQIFCFCLYNNVSLIFEVIDIENDSHIVEYDSSHIVLLDIIYNDFSYKKHSYVLLEDFAKKINVEYKKYLFSLFDEKEFEQFYQQTKKEKQIEGYVLEDSFGFQVKIKTNWYQYWKSVRAIYQLICAGKIDKAKERIGNNSYLFNFLLAHKNENLSLITLRKKFICQKHKDMI